MNPEINRIARIQIGEFIQTLIKDRGLVIEQIEKETGLSKHIIYKIMHGKGYTIDSLLLILRFLNIHLELSEKTPETSNLKWMRKSSKN